MSIYKVVIIVSIMFLLVNSEDIDAALDQRVSAIETNLSVLKVEVADLKGIVSSQNARITDQLQKIAEQGIEIADLADKVAKQDTAIANQDRLIAEEQLRIANAERKHNILLGKTTAQISDAFEGISSRAVDDGWNPYYHNHSCTHTEEEDNPWWHVDLVNRYTIFSVVLQNRIDCCSKRLFGAEVFVGDSLEVTNMHLCGKFEPPPSGSDEQKIQELQEIKCFPPVTGRYLKIQIPRHDFLTLCEVAVYEAFKAN